MATSVHYSHAGHDFHVLWAARRVLGLIDDKTDLRLVTVEGVAPEDATPDDDWVLAVDIAEYFGGESANSAERAVFSQLKYSTRYPERAWTAARFTAKSSRGKRSVIRRLTDVFQALDRELGREKLIETSVIRLVSNQPADQRLVDALDAATTALETRPYRTSAGQCFKGLSESHRGILDKLRQASRLPSPEFADFLRILDVSGCGAEGRAIQRLKLADETARHVVHSPRSEILSLQDLVSSRMQPEGADMPGIKRPDVLIALGVSHEDYLFPARPRFQKPMEMVRSPDAESLAEVVIQSSSQKILAYGDAGVGKTTTVLEFSSHLPDGSVVIPYDCFGAGEYTNAGHERHLPGWALLQIVNDVALKCGTPVLVPNTWSIDSELWRHFTHVVEDAAGMLPSGALLVIAIDAADNSVVAARQAGQKAFIDQLWTVDLPANARVVVTSRSHRTATLNAPSDVASIQLQGFDAAASAAHLRTKFSTADEHSADLFHRNSGGNPRVQYYALQASSEHGSPGLSAVLARSSATPHDIFEDLVGHALEQVTDPTSAHALLATLFVLNRAAEIGTIAEIESRSKKDARLAVRALIPGIVIEDDKVSFRDENFETFVRDRLGQERLLAAEDRVATFYSDRADRDSEAAARVADHLYRAHRYQELIRLAIENEEPAAIDDELARANVKRRRIELGLQAAADADSPLDAAQLLVLAAEAARTRAGFASIIRSNPELAAQYADPEAVETLYMRGENAEWRGPAHLRMAAVLSRHEETFEEARNQLDLADAWLKRWSLLPNHERNTWELTAEDVAAGVEAIATLYGWEEGKEWLLRWKPHEFVVEVSTQVATRVAAKYSVNELEDKLREVGASAWQQAAYMVASARSGNAIPPRWRHRVARRLEAIPLTHARLADPPSWGIELCEVMAQAGCGRARLRRLLKRFGPSRSGGWSGYRDPFDKSHSALRRRCLEASAANRRLTIDEVVPPVEDDNGTSEVRNRDQRERDVKELSPLLDALQLRADGLVGANDNVTRLDNLVAKGASLTQWSPQQWQRNQTTRSWARWAVEACLMFSTDTRGVIDQILAIAEEVLGSGARWLYIDVAPALLLDGRYNGLAADLLDRIDESNGAEPLPTAERRDLLLAAADVADSHQTTRTLARDLFERAVNAARDIDDGVASLIHLRERIAIRISGSIDRDRAARIAQGMARAVELSEPYVSDPAEVLPYSSTIRSVTRLDPPTGFALLSRWDYEDRASSTTDITSVVEEATAMRFISPEQGLALLRMHESAGGSSANSVLDLLNELHPDEHDRLVRAVNRLASWIEQFPSKHIRVGMARRTAVWAEHNSLSGLASIQRLQALTSYAETFARADEVPPSYKSSREGISLRRVSAPTASQAIRTLRNRLLRLSDSYLEHDQVANIIRQGSEPIRPAERVPYLESLLDLAQEELGSRSVIPGIARALRGITEAWASDPKVRAWCSNRLGGYLEDNLPELLFYDADQYRYRRRVEIPDNKIARPLHHLVRAAAKHLEVLTATDRYAVAEAAVDLLGVEQAACLLEWSLREHLSEDTTNRSLPTDPTALIAGFFWGLFGHPDKRIRWRAAHACREIVVGQSGDAVAQRLVELLPTETAVPFTSDRFSFLTLSARMWSLLVLCRIAAEAPERLKEATTGLVAIALDRNSPHVAIRELARRTVLHICREYPDLLTPFDKAKVEFANRPLSCRVAPAEFSGRGAAFINVDTTFDFDAIDTLRYWYPQLADVFDVDTERIAKMADRWITNVWGRNNEEANKDRLAMRSRYDYTLTSNDHGSHPIVETLPTYLEYHAMLTVAGELADSGSQAVPQPYYDKEDPWMTWVAPHLEYDDGFWHADLRSPAPLEPEIYGQLPVDEQLQKVEESDYARALGVGDTSTVGSLVVDGDVSMYQRGSHVSVRVWSALVSPESSLALLRSLELGGTRDVSLPTSDSAGQPWSDEILETGFTLTGWLAQTSRTRESIDRHDPMAHELPSEPTTFGPDFLNHVSMILYPTTVAWSTLEGDQVAAWIAWSDSQPEVRGSESDSSAGHRTCVRLDVLLEFLKSTRTDLILRVFRSWSASYASRTQGEDAYGESHKFYVLKGNARLETLGRHRQLRPANSRGA